jgi:hypothetical protein
MRSLLITVAAAALAAACANAPQEAITSYYAKYSSEQQDHVPAFKDRRLERFTNSQMEKFDSEYEFLQYVRDVKREVERRGEWWAGPGVQYAQVGPPIPPPCDPEKEDCPEEKGDPVVVTGSRISAPAESFAVSVTTFESLSVASGSITNNQNVGVDEGDIVKLIGRFLVVLQDGRLFAVDLLPDGKPGMRLADRRNVYDKPDDDGWYDEMLVTGNRILITSYSYEEDGTKLSVFRIDDKGRMTGEGAFVISSNDYYSVDNYATRMVGDKLVIYSPVHLRDIDPDEPAPWPVVRRWTKNSDRAETEGTPLFDARGIYRPMQPTLDPVVHTVSVCDLGTASAETGLPCRSNAITGPPDAVFYVSPTDAYLWAPSTDDWWQDRCLTNDRQVADGIPGGLYRLPLSGGRVKMMNVKGAPQDQFAIDTSTDEIRSLVIWGATGCDEWGDEGMTQLKYFSAPLSMFRDDIRTPSGWHYTGVPAPGGESFENRFTGDHVVYGAKAEPWYWSYAPDADEPPQESHVVAVPLKRPSEAAVLKAPHGVMRAERVGNNAVLTGYRDNAGLSLSFVDLSGEPRIAATEVLEGRYESEGRSHAFNSRVDEGGGGMLGIPTVKRERDSGRWWWRSRTSDVSFLTFDRTGTMFEAGELAGREDSEDPAYKCEVSCIDWYGNSRPFFIAGRIFALTGTEMVEGSLAEGQVLEVRRVNLTSPVK